MCFHITCPHCGYKPNEDATSHASSTLRVHTPKDELDFINEEIRRLDDVIRPLQQKRSMLLNRTNTIRASTGALPSEILSHIFRFACPVIEFRKPSQGNLQSLPSVLRLTAVCSQWRQVATSIPELWATVSIDITHSTACGGMSILKTCFENSKYYPMSLSLNYEVFSDIPSDLSLEYLVLDTVRGHEDKIESLQIEDMAFDCINNFEWDHFHALTDLRLFWGSYVWVELDADPFFLPDTIQKLSTRNLAVGDSKFLPFSNLTTLHLNDTPIRDCVVVLVECPNLLKFSSIDPWEEEDSDLPNISQTVTLKHLEELEWHWLEDTKGWNDTFLQYFKFPALQKLRWRKRYRDCHRDPDDPIITAFFSDLPPTVKKLDIVIDDPEHGFMLLVDSEQPEEMLSCLTRALHDVPSVVELVVEIDAGRGVTEAAQGVLEILRTDNEEILPSLKMFCLKMVEPHTFARAPVFRTTTLVEMLTRRRKIGLEAFKLIWDGDILALDEERKKMAELMAGGLSIEITQKRSTYQRYMYGPLEL